MNQHNLKDIIGAFGNPQAYAQAVQQMQQFHAQARAQAHQGGYPAFDGMGQLAPTMGVDASGLSAGPALGFPSPIFNGAAVSGFAPPIAANPFVNPIVQLAPPPEYGVARKELLGFGDTCVGAGQVVAIDANPQVAVQPYKLYISPTIASNFQVLAITFGKWNLFTNGGSIPADMFSNSVDCNDFNGITLPANAKVTLTVQNTSNTDQPFRAGMWVAALEGC